MEPPGLISSPSRVTSRRDCLYFLAIRIPQSIFSTTIVRPRSCFASPRKRSSTCTSVWASPITPVSFSASICHRLCAALHTCQRQKCRASVLILLQICDHPLCSLFIVRHNILDTASKRCLYCNFIFFFYLDDVRHNTDQTFFPVLAAHNTTDAVSVSVISFCNIFQRLQSGGFSVICSLTDPQFFPASHPIGAETLRCSVH